jgi:predicted PhzF superfamily epimerase YddE/YHI9
MKDEEPSQSLPPWSSRPRHHFWIVDAFAERPFAGNPAGVVDVGGPDQTPQAKRRVKKERNEGNE